MPRVLSAKVRDAVLAAKRRGCTETKALEEASAAGLDVSSGSVHNIYAADATGAKKGPRGGAKRRVRSTAPNPKTKAPPSPSPDDDPVAMLRSSVGDLRDLAAIAKASGEITEFASLSRAINQTIALAAKLSPPPPVDPNENPDMKEAAKRARTRLHELLDRALAEVA